MSLVSSSLGGLKEVATVYAKHCSRHPFLVNAACGCAFASAGDAICQLMVDAKQPNPNNLNLDSDNQLKYKYDVRRTVNIGLIR